MDTWEVKRDGVVCARPSIPYLGYPQATLKLLKEAGYRIYCNGRMVR